MFLIGSFNGPRESWTKSSSSTSRLSMIGLFCHAYMRSMLRTTGGTMLTLRQTTANICLTSPTAFQNGGWRQFRIYPRAPMFRIPYTNIRMSFRKWIPRRSYAASRHWRARPNPSLSCHADLKGSHFFAALHHTNFVRRLADEAPAPSLNWTVVRTTSEETDERLWHLLFRRVFGASSAEFDQVRFSPTPEAAAAVIARAMNRQIPEERIRGEAAPDLLILLGCKKLETSEEDEDLLAIVRPLSFPGVINALESKNIHPIRDIRLRGLVGATRIVLIEEDERVGAPSTNVDFLDRDDQEIMARLRTFRFGFTQPMAAIALNHMITDPLYLRSKLQTLLHRDALTYGGGWYCLRDRPSTVFTPTRTDRQAATDHFFAGLAFAPYLLKRPVPGLNIGDAPTSRSGSRGRIPPLSLRQSTPIGVYSKLMMRTASTISVFKRGSDNNASCASSIRPVGVRLGSCRETALGCPDEKSMS